MSMLRSHCNVCTYLRSNLKTGLWYTESNSVQAISVLHCQCISCTNAGLNDLDAWCCEIAGARGHDLFLDFVGKAFNVPEAYPDLTVDFGDETVYAHKFLLAVRAPAIGERQYYNATQLICMHVANRLHAYALGTCPGMCIVS